MSKFDRRICIFTSNRADWGLLNGLAKKLSAYDTIDLKILVSGSHLREAFGSTVSEIKMDGFAVDKAVDILKFEESPLGICKTIGLAVSEFGSALTEIGPDILVVLGDRFETLAVATAGYTLGLTIAHLHGGETTEGVIDEAFRHSITKMSAVHFPVCDIYSNRVKQLGESPSTIFNFGALGVENAKKTLLLDVTELSNLLRFDFNQPFFIVTYHPVHDRTLTSIEQFKILEDVLSDFRSHNVLFTYSNADFGGTEINRRIESLVKKNPQRMCSTPSLGSKRFLSALKLCDAIIGNSSSGIIEAPSFDTLTVNIGDRQKGRVRAPSVLDCELNHQSLHQTIASAVDPAFRSARCGVENPFEKDNTAANIADILATIDFKSKPSKAFFDISCSKI